MTLGMVESGAVVALVEEVGEGRAWERLTRREMARMVRARLARPLEAMLHLWSVDPSSFGATELCLSRESSGSMRCSVVHQHKVGVKSDSCERLSALFQN